MSIKENKENKGSIEKVSVVSVIKKWQEDAETDSCTWRERLNKWYRLRFRVKKQKDKPFVGCSNIRMPTLDTAIHDLKASFYNGVFGVRPVVQVIPTPSGNVDTANKIEKFLDHLIMDVIKIKPKAIMAIDQMLQMGFYLLKPFWNIKVYNRNVKFVIGEELSEQELAMFFNREVPKEELVKLLAAKVSIDTNKMVVDKNVKELIAGMEKFLEGEESYTFKLSDVVANHPDVSLVDPERLYVPAHSGVSPKDAQYLIHEFYISYEELVQNVHNKDWKASALDTIEYCRSKDISNSETTKNQREGINLISDKNLIKIWETYCYWDINNDGKDEKCVITISPDFDIVLRAIELPFHSYEFPFVKLSYELTQDRWYSPRGLPELSEDLVKEIDTQHMQRIDSQSLRNTPQFIFRAGQVSAKSKNFGFARGIPVSGHHNLDDIIKPFSSTNSNAEFSYKDEQQILESKLAGLIGRVDFGLQSQINRRQPRTEGEVQLHVQSGQSTFNLDMDMQRQQFEELFQWIYYLWCQFGDDEYEFSYFGGQSKPETVRISREEIQGKYTIKVRANDNNSNPEVRQKKARLILQDTYAALQNNLVAPESAIEARKQAMVELGIENYERFMIPPQPQNPKPPIQPIVIQMEDLTDAERAQVLQNIGISPDVNNRIKKQQIDEQQRTFDNQLEVAKELNKAKK